MRPHKHSAIEGESMKNRKPCLCYFCNKTIEKGQIKKRVHKQNFAHVACERIPKKSLNIFDKIVALFK